MLCSHEEPLLKQTEVLQALACKRKNLRARNLQMSQNLLSSNVNFYGNILGGPVLARTLLFGYTAYMSPT